MKKFLLKLGVFVVISMICGWTLQAIANTEAELPKALDDAKAKQCITDYDKEHGYIYTKVEEPIILEKDGDTKNGDKFVSRICYRNTFTFTITTGDNQKEDKTLDELSEICSENVKNSQNYQAENKVRASCKAIQVFLTKGGASMIEGYIGTMYKWGVSIVGIIAVLVITISGIQIAVAGGESAAIDEAKKRIMKSFIGIAVLLLSSLILYTINPNFFTTK